MATLCYDGRETSAAIGLSKPLCIRPCILRGTLLIVKVDYERD